VSFELTRFVTQPHLPLYLSNPVLQVKPNEHQLKCI